MKFETVYKMAAVAEEKNVDIVWFGKSGEMGGYDLREEWACTFEQVPFWVSLLDIHSVSFGEYGADIHIFLDEPETDMLWTKVIDLA